VHRVVVESDTANHEGTPCGADSRWVVYFDLNALASWVWAVRHGCDDDEEAM